MSRTTRNARRRQTLGEEIANSVSHGVGLLAAIVALPILIVSARERGSPEDVFGAAVFGASAVLLYLSSTLYHGMAENRAKRILQVVDHGAIFLLIAGSYTPFTLGVLRGPFGWALFGVVWLMAFGGIILKVVYHPRFPKASTALYLVMGWMSLVAIGPMIERMPAAGVAWVVAGGLAYTVGVTFFLLDRLPYAHFVWHVFVLAGTSCHFVATLRYAVQDTV